MTPSPQLDPNSVPQAPGDPVLLAQNTPRPLPGRSTAAPPMPVASPSGAIPFDDSDTNAALTPAELAKQTGYRDYSKLLNYPSGAVRTFAIGLMDYTMPYPSAQLARESQQQAKTGREGIWTQALRAATEVDPSFDSTQYAGRQRAVNDFSSTSPGKPGFNKLSVNTALSHLAGYKYASDALGNFDTPVIARPLNAVVNAIEYGSGPGTKMSTLKTAQQALASELTSAFRGSTGSVADVEAWKNNLGENMSHAQQQAAADGAVALLANRLRQLRQQYIDTIGRPPPFKFLQPDSRAILKKMGYDPEAVESGVYGAPGGMPPGNLQTNTNQQGPDPKQHYIPGHIYGGKTFIGPGIDQAVNNPASWK